MRLPRLHELPVSLQLSLLVSIVLLVGIFFSVNSTLMQQQQRSNASQANQVAVSACDAQGKSVIRAGFVNADTASPVQVRVQDIQTGVTAVLGTIAPEETKSVQLSTGKSSLQGSGVVFFISGTQGQAGVREKSAAYSAITCQVPQ